jgi:hypothetical protein
MVEDLHIRKSSEGRHLSGIQKRYSNGISDWARQWGLTNVLCHRVGKKSNEDDTGSDEE